MRREINVHLKQETNRSYRIGIRAGGLSTVPEFVARTWKDKRIFLITDTNVERLWGRALHRSMFETGCDVLMLSIPPGEESKNSRLVDELHSQLLTGGIRRGSVIVALGGGVVGDIAGYAAATVLRGVAYILVPTTLLAQVDSCVGGKVGIDHALGKNLIGAFHQPSAVFIDPGVLATLPQREFRNGLAEAVKIAAALDRKFFEMLEKNSGRLAKTNSKLLVDVISRSVGVKAGIVEADEFEQGIRRTLNVGHTIGHALETATNYTLKHGEAVAIGIAAEAKLAVWTGFLKEDECDRIIKLLRALHLPTGMPHVQHRERFFAALAADKKSSDGAPKFVLLNGIGSAIVGVDVPFHYIEELITRAPRRA